MGLVMAALRLVQLSDLHLCAQPGGLWDMSVDTDRTLAQVLAQIPLHEPDLVIVTGDLAQDPVPEAYERLRQQLSQIPAPVAVLPGNHDQTDLLKTMLVSENLSSRKQWLLGEWQILLLDSSCPQDSQGGRLAETELAWLEATLSAHPDTHCLVCLHHHPLAVGTPWLDSIGLANADAFLACLDRHSQVRGVLFGHIHQAFEADRKGVPYWGCPATSVQFQLHQPHFGVNDEAPAWRWLELAPNGEILTQVKYLTLQTVMEEIKTGAEMAPVSA
jgi:Icc protein